MAKPEPSQDMLTMLVLVANLRARSTFTKVTTWSYSRGKSNCGGPYLDLRVLEEQFQELRKAASSLQIC